MKRYVLALGVLATLPVLACGAAPEGTTAEGAASDEVGTSSEALAFGPQHIDFDIDPGGAFVTDVDAVNSLYWLKGVTLTCESCAGQDVFARSPGRTDNGVSILQKIQANWNEPQFSAFMGFVRATFVRPASCVSIDAWGATNPLASPFFGPQGAPWLEADDANGNPVAIANYQGALQQWQTLSICTGSYNIASVRFSSGDVKSGKNAVLGRFDNLVFDGPPIVKQPPIKPPSIL